MPGVVDVRFVEREPAEKRNLLSWEQVILLPDEICIENNVCVFFCTALLSMSLCAQKNNCILPEDLRDFYLTTDGFTLTWSIKLDSRRRA